MTARMYFAPPEERAKLEAKVRQAQVWNAPYNAKIDTTDQIQSLPADALFADVETSQLVSPVVPPGFLGVSREWGNLAHYAKTPEALAAFSNIFRALGPGPILRIGGRSQELLTDVPPVETWQALAALKASAGMRFVIGLPLEKADVDLARRIMDTARQYLGDAIVGFELGNEPGARCESALLRRGQGRAAGRLCHLCARAFDTRPRLRRLTCARTAPPAAMWELGAGGYAKNGTYVKGNGG